MRSPVARFSPAAVAAGLAASLLGAAPPAIAQPVQTRPGEQRQTVYGERYSIEMSTTWWTPSVYGFIQSSSIDAIGSSLSFTDDLGYESTRFRDLRFVIRPAKKHRIRIQYTPIEYTAAATFNRDVTFRGEVFPVSVPIESRFGWHVWRTGYEYDFLYHPRAFVGVLAEARFIDMTAELTSPIASATVDASAVVPALGVFGRAYVLPDLAINFEWSGFQVPEMFDVADNTQSDWDLYATINVTNNFGGQIGWRKATTFLKVQDDTGDLKFEGIWFGLVLRY
jgi:hypothetical protein